LRLVAPTAGLLGRGVERGAMAAGRAGERYAEKVVPQIMERGGLPAQLLGDLSQGSISPMDVWHGTPHGPFPKFDSSKIGTGEGAQAYGHGIYTGEARGTGEEYRKALTGNQYGDKLVPTVDGIPSDTPILRNLVRNGQSPEDFIASMQNKLKSQETALSKASKEEILPGVSDYDMAEMALGETKKLIDEAKGYVGKEIKAEPIGYLYKVDLPDEAIANMLDWDKPLSKQPKNVQDYFYSHPKVQEYIDNQNAERLRLNEQYPGRLSNPALKNIVNKEMTADSLKGSKLYELATTGYSIKDESIPVEMMRQAGIPGNRYLDQGSRNLESGTSNFVVFPGNENLLTIKEINDKPYEQWFPKTNLLETAEPSPVSSLQDIQNKFKDVALDVYENKGTINLSRIVVPKEMRSTGIGSNVMNDLVGYADATGQKIALTPSDSFGGNVKRLKDFYKEFGFVENKGKNKDFSTMESMIRQPSEIDEKKLRSNLLD